MRFLLPAMVAVGLAMGGMGMAETGTISVTGTGTVSVVPDRATRPGPR